MVAASAVALCRNLCTKILQCHAWCAFGALRVLKLSEGSGFPFKCRFGIPGWVEVKRSQWQGRLSGSGTRLQLVDPALPKSRVFLRLLSPPLGPGRVEEPLPPPSALHGFYLEPGSGVRKTEVFKEGSSSAQLCRGCTYKRPTATQQFSTALLSYLETDTLRHLWFHGSTDVGCARRERTRSPANFEAAGPKLQCGSVATCC